MSTNNAKIFLKLVDKHFLRIHRLHKIFIKVNYSCMINEQQVIKKHNNFIQNQKNKATLSYNCRDKNECSSNENCRTENVIYKYTSLTKNNVEKVSLGVSEGEFKKNRHNNHQQSVRNEHYKNSNTLSTYLRSIKSEDQNVNLSWEKMREVGP